MLKSVTNILNCGLHRRILHDSDCVCVHVYTNIKSNFKLFCLNKEQRSTGQQNTELLNEFTEVVKAVSASLPHIPSERIF